MMRFFSWLFGYFAALALEVSFLPSFFGTAVPSLYLMPLILGIVSQGFWPGLWLSGLAGFVRDVLVSGTGGAQTVAALIVFLAMRLFLALDLFDVPLQRIGAIAAGLVVVPVASRLAVALAQGFGAAAPSFPGADFVSAAVLREIAFAAAWFFLASWLIVRSAQRHRREALHRIA